MKAVGEGLNSGLLDLRLCTTKLASPILETWKVHLGELSTFTSPKSCVESDRAISGNRVSTTVSFPSSVIVGIGLVNGSESMISLKLKGELEPRIASEETWKKIFNIIPSPEEMLPPVVLYKRIIILPDEIALETV